ncbi:hypothetical protein PPTG_17372 [Phytophthora nicotianae INRA-310]|uniref:Uncharacterized protein n=1 Tax=Phytophthora nicotianae (strain INRA-310) TaxID=761204 RepID=W2PN62_PHYN3|nr:hypothetical protein PPTG_17372 [Phytophthora nicotianae INRA-310]ETN01470.1 hypothetical protein PPTG_17372 [Phytophthora nicotianae INRA-310]
MAMPHLRQTARPSEREGYTNLIDHLQRAGSDATIDSAYKHILRHGTSIPVVNVSSLAKDIHEWIEWTVMENRPLSFWECELVRKNTTLPKINAKSRKGHIRALVDVVRSEIKANLAGQWLGLVFDGWSKNGYHFVIRSPSSPPKIHLTPPSVRLIYFRLNHSKPETLARTPSSTFLMTYSMRDNASVNISVGKKVKVP